MLSLSLLAENDSSALSHMIKHIHNIIRWNRMKFDLEDKSFGSSYFAFLKLHKMLGIFIFIFISIFFTSWHLCRLKHGIFVRNFIDETEILRECDHQIEVNRQYLFSGSFKEIPQHESDKIISFVYLKVWRTQHSFEPVNCLNRILCF